MDNFDLRKYLAEGRLLKEELTPPMEDYLLGMFEEFVMGNDNEYPIGTEMETRYEEIEKGDDDLYGEEKAKLFYDTRDFLNTQGPTTLMRKQGKGIELIFSIDGDDIVLNWIEPDWDNLAEGKLLKETIDFPEMEDEFEGYQDAMLGSDEEYLQGVIDDAPEEFLDLNGGYYEVALGIEQGRYSAEEAVELAKSWAKEKLTGLSENKLIK